MQVIVYNVHWTTDTSSIPSTTNRYASLISGSNETQTCICESASVIVGIWFGVVLDIIQIISIIIAAIVMIKHIQGRPTPHDEQTSTAHDGLPTPHDEQTSTAHHGLPTQNGEQPLYSEKPLQQQGEHNKTKYIQVREQTPNYRK